MGNVHWLVLRLVHVDLRRQSWNRKVIDWVLVHSVVVVGTFVSGIGVVHLSVLMIVQQGTPTLLTNMQGW